MSDANRVHAERRPDLRGHALTSDKCPRTDSRIGSVRRPDSACFPEARTGKNLPDFQRLDSRMLQPNYTAST